MKNFFSLILLALVLSASSCGTVRPVLGQDSTHVEVVEKIVRDTAYIELPVLVEKVATLDTSSTLENPYAKSEAVVSAGILHHSLETKSVQHPVPVESKIVYRDSIVFRDRIVEKPVEVERKLTLWQRFKLAFGGYACLMAILMTIMLLLVFNSIYHLKTFKL